MQHRAEQPETLAPVGEERPVHRGRCGRLVTAARRLSAGEIPEDPARLLDSLAPPRGAWERQGRWAVFGGTALALQADAGDGSRFASVREQAAAWVGEAVGGGAGTDVPDGGRDAPPPRLYGGFSFHSAPDVSGRWSDFPPALFRVPAREVRVEGEGAWLVATRAVGGNGEEAAWAGARRELERLEARIAPPTSGENGYRSRPDGADAATDPGAWDEPDGERERWERGVREALGRIRAGVLEKVVLSRTLDVPAADAVDPVRAYRRLRADNPRSSLFFVQPEAGTAFLGGSPELLGAARGSVFRATAVAGSVTRGRSPEEDRALGRRLLESEKDRREQAIVAEEIRRCLSRRLRAVSVGSPRLLKLARIQHLESSVEGRFPDGGEAGPPVGDGSGGRPHLLDVIADLHPTPAVCGRPREEALRVLRRSEPFERGWYAGPVGWLDPAGRGAFVPGLRSALLRDGGWRLFAGAGIVEGSDPEREWEETDVKFVPMLRALGAGDGS